ncbi:MAG TPA: isocitrate lyase/PEP mutase family protein [Burkholderiales bacterium]|nr:isocitrate lyase/PEP mutase family protein [Burkholderiales bacterium]
MSRWQDRRNRFRALLSGSRCIHPGSVFDPISARIAEDLGFEAGMFAGSIASLTVLGAPDLIVLTLTEFAAQANRICRAGSLPLMCDADHGYGNALNVMRTVEELEMAGVAGLSIEDTDLPQPFGSGGRPRLLSVEEGVGKMKAALAGRNDPGLVIAGRTSAPGMSGIADAIVRAKAYEKAGVDAIFLVGVKTRADLDAVAAEVRLPLILGGAGKEIMDLELLSQRGVRICLQGHQPFAAAVRAVHDTLKALRDGTPPEKLEGVAGDDMMKRYMRNDGYARWVKDWL